MKSIRNPLANPFLAWAQLAWKTGEMMAASAQVIQHRTGRMAAAAVPPSARDQREFSRMGQEKFEAAGASAQALAARMATMQMQLGALAFRQLLNGANGMMSLAATPAAALTAKGQAALLRTMLDSAVSVNSQVAGALARLAQHGLKPIHARATANAKRLSNQR